MKRTILMVTLFCGALAGLKAEQPEQSPAMSDCPMMKDGGGMKERSDKGMGFSQDKTTHHFTLGADGGAIEVAVNEAADEASRAEIRGHLGHIAKMFEHGNFDIPIFVHGKMPDGVAVMQREKANIRYIYEETKSGGRVRIETSNPEALKAVHDFLRFQISEHQTGDAMEVSR